MSNSTVHRHNHSCVLDQPQTCWQSPLPTRQGIRRGDSSFPASLTEAIGCRGRGNREQLPLPDDENLGPGDGIELSHGELSPPPTTASLNPSGLGKLATSLVRKGQVKSIDMFPKRKLQGRCGSFNHPFYPTLALSSMCAVAWDSPAFRSNRNHLLHIQHPERCEVLDVTMESLVG